MKVMGIDSDSAFGWALYDTEKPPSAIECGALNLKGETIVEKLVDMRVRFVPLLKELSPDFAGIEAPSKFLRKYPDKSKTDMLSPLEHQRAAQDPVRWKEQSTVPIAITNQIAGAATVLLLCWNVRCQQYEPRSWQTIIPKQIKGQFSGEGAPKKAAHAYCSMLKIPATNQSARDACLIALYVASAAAELKMLERAKAS